MKRPVPSVFEGSTGPMPFAGRKPKPPKREPELYFSSGSTLYRYDQRTEDGVAVVTSEKAIWCVTEYKKELYVGDEAGNLSVLREGKLEQVAKAGGTICCATRYKGELYVGNRYKLSVLRDGKLEPVANTENWILCATSYKGELYVGEMDGRLSVLHDGKLEQVTKFSKPIERMVVFGGPKE